MRRNGHHHHQHNRNHNHRCRCCRVPLLRSLLLQRCRQLNKVANHASHTASALPVPPPPPTPPPSFLLPRPASFPLPVHSFHHISQLFMCPLENSSTQRERCCCCCRFCCCCRPRRKTHHVQGLRTPRRKRQPADQGVSSGVSFTNFESISELWVVVTAQARVSQTITAARANTNTAAGQLTCAAQWRCFCLPPPPALLERCGRWQRDTRLLSRKGMRS